jgi:hypothetical protein
MWAELSLGRLLSAGAVIPGALVLLSHDWCQAARNQQCRCDGVGGDMIETPGGRLWVQRD